MMIACEVCVQQKEQSDLTLCNRIWADGCIETDILVCSSCLSTDMKDICVYEPVENTSEDIEERSTSQVPPFEADPSPNKTKPVTDSKTPDLDAMILALLEKNPGLRGQLLGERRTAVRTPTVNNKPRPKGTFDRILLSKHLCLLCGDVKIDARRISWDSNFGIYSTAKVPSENLPETLPVENRFSESCTCENCKTVLSKLHLDDLVSLTILLQNPILSAARDSKMRRKLRSGSPCPTFDIDNKEANHG